MQHTFSLYISGLQRETSRNFPFTRFTCSCSPFFSLPLTFTLVAASISPFSYHHYIIFMFFFQRNWSPLFFISRSSSFSVVHVNADIKIKSKERIRFVVVVFLSLKVDLSPKRAGVWNAKFHPGQHEGVDVLTYDFLRTKISCMQIVCIGGFHAVSRDTNNNGEMNKCWWTNKAS